MTVEPRLRDDNADLPAHGRQVYDGADHGRSDAPRRGRTPAAPIPATCSRPARVACSSIAAPASSHVCASESRWPHVDAIAITHFHLDHWGDLVPWVWGSFYRARRGRRRSGRTSGYTRAGERISRHSGSGLASPTCSNARSSCTSTTGGEPFVAAGFELVPSAAPLHTGDLRLPRRGGRQDGGVLGRQRAERPAGRARTRRGPLHLRGDARAR